MATWNNYSDFRGKTFVFVGQNASTGEPNSITGRMSFYGFFVKFDSRKTAKQYVEDNETGYAGEIIEIGSARALRKYDLGSSVDGYLENLKYLETFTGKDEFGRWR